VCMGQQCLISVRGSAEARQLCLISVRGSAEARQQCRWTLQNGCRAHTLTTPILVPAPHAHSPLQTCAPHTSRNRNVQELQELHLQESLPAHAHARPYLQELQPQVRF